jgi:hypothetical protein
MRTLDRKLSPIRSSTETRRVIPSYIPLIAVVGVIGYYLWYVSSLAINIPYHDDIFDLLRFVTGVDKAETVLEKLALLHEPYNDHRTSATRLLVYGVYLLEGEVNFRTLTIIANLALPLMLLLLYFAVRGDPDRWVWLLIAALILLNPRIYTIVLHAQSSFAFLYVVLYAFAGLFALHRVTPARFVLAVLLCSLSTFTLASGKLVWLLGLVSLLHQSQVLKQRSYWYPLVWLMIAVPVIAVWQFGFLELIYAKNDELLLGERVWRYLALLLVMLGSAISDTSTLVAAILGIVIVVVLLVQTAQSLKRQDIRLLLCCWYAFLSAAAMTIGRAAVVQPEYALTERYASNSIFLICCLTVLMLSQSKSRRMPVIALIVAAAGIYANWSYRHFEERLLSTLQVRFEHFNNHQYLQAFRKPEDSNAVVHEAIRAGIYLPPCRPFPACESGTASNLWPVR